MMQRVTAIYNQLLKPIPVSQSFDFKLPEAESSGPSEPECLLCEERTTAALQQNNKHLFFKMPLTSTLVRQVESSYRQTITKLKQKQTS